MSPGRGAAVRGLLRASVAHPEHVPGLAAHAERHGLDSLTATAVAHGVAGLLHAAVRSAGLAEAPGAAALAQETQRSVLQHARALVDLGGAVRVLSPAGVPVTVVKGPALVQRWYRPGERGYADLDVVVPPGSFELALATLEGAGYRLLDANWPLLLRERVAQLRLRAPSGGLVDLHWHLLNDHRARDVHHLGQDVWGNWVERVELGGSAVDVLRPEACLVHLCVHAAASGAHRLLWLGDVDRVSRDVADWPAVLELARRAAVVPALGIVLGRTARVLGTPVPGRIRAAVLPWPARAVAGLVDLVSPVPGGTATGSVAQLTARSATADWRGTSARLLARSASWARRGSRAGQRSAAALFDATDPASAVHPAGGPAGRRAYLTWVSAAS